MLRRILRSAYRRAEAIGSALAARRALRAEYRAYVERRRQRLEELLATP
jgi:hypothetical protein